MSSAEYGSNLSSQEQSQPQTVSLLEPPNSVDLTGSAKQIARLRKHVQTVWTRLGEERPHWSVLSSDHFQPDRIEQTEASFYASGDQDADLIRAVLARHDLSPDNYETCFEFGCGLGRVTIPLAGVFRKVIACDISTSHLSAAGKRIKSLGIDNIKLVQAETTDFGMNDRFDFWFSRIVLQHNPPPIIRLILSRMFEQLNPGGVAMFQVPVFAKGYAFDLKSYLSCLSSENRIEMHCYPQSEIFSLAAEYGVTPLEVREEYSAGPPQSWISNMFVFRKKK